MKRVTDDRARHYKQLCPRDNGVQVNCYGCHYNEERYETCPSTWGSSLLAADLLEARAQLAVAEKALENIRDEPLAEPGKASDEDVDRCVSCRCVIDKEYNGHHSAADCKILKYAEAYHARELAEESAAILAASDRLGAALGESDKVR